MNRNLKWTGKIWRNAPKCIYK